MSIHYATIIDYTAFVIIGWMILDFLWWGRKAFKAHYQDITGYVESLETLARFAEIDRDDAEERADIAEAQYRDYLEIAEAQYRDYLEYVKRSKETDKIQEQRRREYFATRPIKDWTPEDQTHEWAKQREALGSGYSDPSVIISDDETAIQYVEPDQLFADWISGPGNQLRMQRRTTYLGPWGSPDVVDTGEMESAGYPEGTE